MTLRFKVFGYVLAEVELDIQHDGDTRLSPVDQGLKKVSHWWVRKAIR